MALVAWGSAWAHQIWQAGAWQEVQPSGGWQHIRSPRTEDEVRREREDLGILPRAQEVIEAVAQRQAEDLRLDEQQRLEELERELQLKGIELETRYLTALNERRQALIDAEIGRRVKQAQENDEVALLLLMAAAV